MKIDSTRLFYWKNETRPPINPLIASLSISALFVIFSLLYINISGSIAYKISDNVSDLKKIELIKGSLYVISAGILFFSVIYYYLKRLRKSTMLIIESNKTLINKERQNLASLIAASIIHDINNLNQIITSNIYFIKSDLKEPEQNIKESIGEIETASSQLISLSKNLTNTIRNSYTDSDVVADLTEIIDETIKILNKNQNIKSCRITTEMPDMFKRKLNPLFFSQALLNLIINAADAAGEKGIIKIKLFTDMEDNTIIEVHDNGHGIPSEEINNIFKPFYTTKEQGTGLGLLSVKSFVQGYGGSVTVTESELGGACFQIKIPESASYSDTF